MADVRRTDAFEFWYDGLRDERAQARIDIRSELIVLLGGGDKKSQAADIKAARELAGRL